MSIFFGVVDFGRPARLAPRKAIRYMADVHGTILSQKLVHFADGWFAMGYLPERFQVADTKNIFYSTERYVVLVDGDVLNKASIAASSRIPLADVHAMQLPELLCVAYQQKGEKLFGEIDGSYCIAIWDSIKKKVVVSSDRNGLRPLYFAKEKDRFLFASEVKILLKGLGKTPSFNRQAVADFLAFGQMIEDTTLFNTIEQIPVGHTITISENDIRIQEYTSERDAQQEKIVDEKDAIDRIRNVFVTGVKASSDIEPTGILLTGGIDSRLIAAAQHRMGYEITTFSGGEANSASAVLARRTAELIGSRHYYLEFTPAHFLENFKRAVWLSDGLASGLHSMNLSLIPLLKQTPLRLLDSLQPLDGKFRNAELALWKHRKWNEEQQTWLAKRVFSYVYQNDDKALPFNGLLLKNTDFCTQQRMKALTKKWNFDHLAPTDAIQSLDRNIRVRYASAPVLNLLRHYVRLSTPFYSFAAIDAVRSLLPKWQSGDKVLIKKIINELNKDLAQVPWQRTMLQLTASPVVEYTHLGAKLLNKLVHFHQHNRAENSTMIKQPLFNFSWHLRNDRNFREEIKFLLLGYLADELFDREAVKSLFVYLTRHQLNVEELICRILTINLWYRYFIQEHSPAEEICSNPNLKLAA
ncbi:MAG: asparagine synthase-related protein, partial [bacterium]